MTCVDVQTPPLPGVGALAYSQARRFIGLGDRDRPAVAIVTSAARKLQRFRLNNVLEHQRSLANTVAHTELWSYQGEQICTLVSGVGGASIDRVFVTALLCGIRVFIRIGSAGALVPNATIGSLLVPTEAIGDSAVLRYYQERMPIQQHSGDLIARPSQALLDPLRKTLSGLKGGPSIVFGRIFSTDLMMHEDDQNVEKYTRLKCVGADMETAPLLAGAMAYRAHAVSMHVVSDHIVQKSFYGDTPELFSAGVDQLHTVLRDFLPHAFEVAAQAEPCEYLS